MLTNVFFPDVPGVRVDRIWREGPTMHLDVVPTRRCAPCPVCHRRSRRVHNHYERTIADLSCCGAGLVIHLRTRRFVCRMRWCRRKIFWERLPDLVAVSARRTTRLHDHVLRAGFGSWALLMMPLSGRYAVATTRIYAPGGWLMS